MRAQFLKKICRYTEQDGKIMSERRAHRKRKIEERTIKKKKIDKESNIDRNGTKKFAKKEKKIFTDRREQTMSEGVKRIRKNEEE